MLFLSGVLVTTLATLTVIPPLCRRAMQRAAFKAEAHLPTLISRARVREDQIRAEYAVERHRFELHLTELRAQNARLRIELARTGFLQTPSVGEKAISSPPLPLSEEEKKAQVQGLPHATAQKLLSYVANLEEFHPSSPSMNSLSAAELRNRLLEIAAEILLPFLQEQKKELTELKHTQPSPLYETLAKHWEEKASSQIPIS